MANEKENKLTIKEKSFKEEEELAKLTGIKDLNKKSHFLVYKTAKQWQLLATKEEKLRTNECPVQNADAKPKDIQQIYDAFSKLTENDYFGLSKEDFNNLKDNLDVLQASLRKNQQAEIEKWVGDKLKVFAKVNGKVVEVEKPLTDKQIDNGDWTDTSIDSKIRYTFDKGVIQVKAFGFRKDLIITNCKTADLIITNCKTADLITIASDIKSKTNKFLSENKVDNYRKEGSFESDEAFADGKKIEVKGKFVKIISEGIGLTTILLKTGQIEKPTYSDTSQATIKAPGLVTGSFEVVAQKVTDITSLATLVYDVAVEEEVRTALKTQFREIKDQIGEDSKEFFPILGEVAVTVLSGNNLEEWKKTVNSTDFGERSHLTTRGIGNTIVSAMSGVALAKNLPEITEKLGEAVKKSKKSVTNISELVKDVVSKRKNIRKVLDTDAGKAYARKYFDKFETGNFEDWYQNTFKKYDTKEPLNFEVHHVIPINVLEENKEFQEVLLWAEKNGKRFDFNSIDNGIPLQKKRIKYEQSGHANHPKYDEVMTEKLLKITESPLSEEKKFDAIKDIIEKTKNKLEQDVLLGNKDVNQIISL